VTNAVERGKNKFFRDMMFLLLGVWFPMVKLRNYIPNDTVSHPRRTEPSAVPL